MWHIAKFEPSEIINIAVEIEKMGRSMYAKLAAKASNEEVKNILQYLASEEEKHMERFRELGKDLAYVDTPETYEGEYFDYLKLSTETHLFNDAEKLEKSINNTSTAMDIINLAAQFEKDTIIFFHGFRNMVAKEKQTVIEDLIMEEQIHLVKLSRLRKAV